MIAILTGCKNNKTTTGSGSNTEMKEASLSLLQTAKKLTIGDTFKLVYSSYNLYGDAVWKSSNINVAIVNEDGVVEAINKGNSIITVTIGDLSASMEIEVGDGSLMPSLEFENYFDEVVTIANGSSVNLGGYIKFNSKRFDDCVIEYSLDDIGMFDFEVSADGVLKSTGKSGKTCTVNVKASWRGIESPLLEKEITVRTIDESVVTLNGGLLNEINIYTKEEFAGLTFKTTEAISSVDIVENGEKINYTNLKIEDESVASISESKVITAKKGGNTNLLIEYSVNGTLKTAKIAVNVIRPIVEYGVAFEYFSILDGKYYDTESDSFKTFEEIFNGEKNVEAYQENNSNISIDNGLVLGVNSTSLEDRSARITVYTEKAGYIFNLNAYTKVIDELKDFEYFYKSPNGVKETVSGYFIQIKDLIDQDYNIADESVALNQERSFNGIFDGLGHTLTFSRVVSDKTRGAYGLFGRTFTGIVRNVNFEDIILSGGQLGAGLICYESYSGSYTTLIENVNIGIKKYMYLGSKQHASNDSGQNILFYSGGWNTLTLSNLVISVEEEQFEIEVDGNTIDYRNDGVPGYDLIGRGGAIKKNNVYLFTNGTSYITEIGNQNESVKNIVSYETKEEMADKSVDLSSLKSYWDIEKGYPVWKRNKQI